MFLVTTLPLPRRSDKYITPTSLLLLRRRKARIYASESQWTPRDCTTYRGRVVTQRASSPSQTPEKGRPRHATAADGRARGLVRRLRRVIRLNPDVIIRSDAHLLPLFARSDVDALFANCPTRMAPALRLRVHTRLRGVAPGSGAAPSFFCHPPAVCRGLLRRPTAAAGTRARYAIRSARRPVRSNPS